MSAVGLAICWAVLRCEVCNGVTDAGWSLGCRFRRGGVVRHGRRRGHRSRLLFFETLILGLETGDSYRERDRRPVISPLAQVRFGAHARSCRTRRAVDGDQRLDDLGSSQLDLVRVHRRPEGATNQVYCPLHQLREEEQTCLRPITTGPSRPPWRSQKRDISSLSEGGTDRFFRALRPATDSRSSPR